MIPVTTTVNVSKICVNANRLSYVTYVLIGITSLLKGANRPPFLAFSWYILAYFGVKVKTVGFSAKFYKTWVDNRYEVCYNVYRNGENADERLTPFALS